MSRLLLVLHWYGPSDNLCQLACRLDGTFAALGYDMLGNVLGKLILPVISDHTVKVHLAVVIDDVPGCHLLTCIHPHVQRRIFSIGKSTFCRIQLIR